MIKIHKFMVNLGRSLFKRRKPPYKVLIEATKLENSGMDGNKRYVVELLQGLGRLQKDSPLSKEFRFEVCTKLDNILPLEAVLALLAPPPPESACDAPAVRSFGPQTLAKSALKFFLSHQVRHGVRHFFKQFTEKNRSDEIVNMHSYDLVHMTTPGAFDLSEHDPKRLLTTVHDLSHKVCPEFQAPVNSRTLARGLRQALERNGVFLSVSEATREQLADYLRLPRATIHHVPEACDASRFHPGIEPEKIASVRARLDLSDTAYVVFVGTLEPRKNLCNAIAAFRRYCDRHPEHDICFAIGGGVGWGDYEAILAEAAKTPQTRLLGRIDDDDLPALYAGSEALVFVSHYEGFGLPPLEAMSCGVPVIYGDNSSLPEIVGDAGLPADSNDVSSICDALERLLTNGDLRRQLAEKAIERSNRFSWDRTARETLELYRRCLEGQQAQPVATAA